MTCDSHWTTYLSALLTPTVAVLGSLIAYRQWRLAQNKLKLDLFEQSIRSDSLLSHNSMPSIIRPEQSLALLAVAQV